MEGNATFAGKVGQMCPIVDDLVQYSPDVVLPLAQMLQEAARRIWILVSNTWRECIPMFDGGVRPPNGYSRAWDISARPE
jgi:hypothetical protein